MLLIGLRDLYSLVGMYGREKLLVLRVLDRNLMKVLMGDYWLLLH
jgi:hypothetical protein